MGDMNLFGYINLDLMKYLKAWRLHYEKMGLGSYKIYGILKRRKRRWSLRSKLPMMKGLR